MRTLLITLSCSLLIACQTSAPVTALPSVDKQQAQVHIAEDGKAYQFSAGEGIYKVRFNYTGSNWTHADVAAIHIDTKAPIAILPQQYTSPGFMMPGAEINGQNIGRQWNEITQQELAARLRSRGFYVLTPTIQQYGENLDGYQAFEHFIAGVHKGNSNVQTVLLTADAHNPNIQNPLPGAQMLVTGTNPRNLNWEHIVQQHIAPFYQTVKLGNRGARVRGGHSDVEGSSAAWHPLIERAAEYGATVSIMEVSRAIDIVEQAGSIEAGRLWAAPLFDAVADALTHWACLQGYALNACAEVSNVTAH